MPVRARIDLPYFDQLLARLKRRDPEFTEAFGRHVHWGYWSRPSRADGTAADFARAAERLCRRICDAAKPKPGMDVLDVGCGFGGTIASLDERIHPLRLTGLNIAKRQLVRARRLVVPHEGNQIAFVEGDACKLPFRASSFDVVLAVECVFHFSSRAAFLRQAARVLRPGGRLVLSDFVATGKAVEGPIPADLVERVVRFYGSGSVVTLADYRALAREVGLEMGVVDDVTRGMLPTWPFAKKLLGRISSDARFATEWVEKEAREGISRYVILTFRRPVRRAKKARAS